MAEARVRLTDTESSSSDGDYESCRSDTESSSSDRSDVNEYGLAFDEIREEEIQEEGQDREKQRTDKTDAFCDVCLMHNLIALSKHVAFYLCYVCERYLCDECFKGHDESHKYINFVSEKSERETSRREFLGEMRNESEREKMFETENVSMVDRVNVKYGLDNKDCNITGVCGLDNTRWVVCDRSNTCIKIFNVGSNLLQRYIRLWSHPYGVTEIKVKREPTEQVVITTNDISVTNRTEPLQSLLAVTLPGKRILLIIDVTQNPAVITKTIKTEKECHSIDFNGEYIVTVCGDRQDDTGYLWFVSVMSTDGVTITTINTDINRWSYPRLAVCSGRFYITDPRNEKVLCLNNEGKVVSHKTIGRSQPCGISVDPDTNKVYICAYGHRKLYRLSSSLESSEPLFDFKSVNSEDPVALCLYRDKLYVGHNPWSTHPNCVTIVRVL